MSVNLAPTDTDLLHRLRHGEENAFALIYQRYVRDLHRYTTARLGTREDAEEIVQEVFLSLWARHRSLREDLVLKAYLFASVKYMILRHISHRKVKQKYAEYYRLFTLVYDQTPEDQRTPEQLEALLQRGIAQLPERCREAVQLRLLENLSNSEIAARMNIGKTTVENYMVSAVKALRKVVRGLSIVE